MEPYASGGSVDHEFKPTLSPSLPPTPRTSSLGREQEGERWLENGAGGGSQGEDEQVQSLKVVPSVSGWLSNMVQAVLPVKAGWEGRGSGQHQLSPFHEANGVTLQPPLHQTLQLLSGPAPPLNSTLTDPALQLLIRARDSGLRARGSGLGAQDSGGSGSERSAGRQGGARARVVGQDKGTHFSSRSPPPRPSSLSAPAPAPDGRAGDGSRAGGGSEGGAGLLMNFAPHAPGYASAEEGGALGSALIRQSSSGGRLPKGAEVGAAEVLLNMIAAAGATGGKGARGFRRVQGGPSGTSFDAKNDD